MSFNINSDKEFVRGSKPRLIGDQELTIRAGTGSTEKEIIRHVSSQFSFGQIEKFVDECNEMYMMKRRVYVLESQQNPFFCDIVVFPFSKDIRAGCVLSNDSCESN